MPQKMNKSAVWISRILIAAVTVMNVQAAFQFMLTPQNYAYGFEMTGTVGEAMVRGMGVLFLMWNIPYMFAAYHPARNFISLVEAVIMQFIGVTGETLILLGMPEGHPLIEASVKRFIIFDGSGLVFLAVALLLVLSTRVRSKR